jgi:putative phage-type endonuclease
MTAIRLGTFTPNGIEWNEARRWAIGGSEIASVLGLSPWLSRFGLWMQKKGFVPPEPDKPVMEWGRRLEPAVRDKFTEDYPGDWVTNPGIYRHDTRSWQLANPDAMTDTELLEVKTAPYADEWGPDGSTEIPIYYRCQVLQYLERAWVAVLIRGTDYRTYCLERDDPDVINDTAILRAAGDEFLYDLINDRVPDIDRHNTTYEIVRTLHPDVEPGQVEIDPDLAGDYLAAYIAEKEAKIDREFYAAKILDELGKTRDAVIREDPLSVTRFAYRTYKTFNGVKGTPYLAVDQARLKQITYPTVREAIA